MKKHLFNVITAACMLCAACSFGGGHGSRGAIDCMKNKQQSFAKELERIEKYRKDMGDDSKFSAALDNYKKSLESMKSLCEKRITAIEASDMEADRELQENEKKLSEAYDQARNTMHFVKSAAYCRHELSKIDKHYGELDGQASQARDRYKSAIENLESTYEDLAASPHSGCHLPENLKSRLDSANLAKNEAEADFYFYKETEWIRRELGNDKLADYPEVRQKGQDLIDNLKSYYDAKKNIARSRTEFDNAKRSAYDDLQARQQAECQAKKVQHEQKKDKKEADKKESGARFCTSCGAKVGADAKFCSKCGAKLDK